MFPGKLKTVVSALLRRLFPVAAVFLGLFGSIGSGPARAQDSDDLITATDSVYIAYIHEILNLSAQYGESIWPGLDYNDVPILIYRPDTVAFLFNHPDPPPEFEPAQGLPWDFENTVWVSRGRFREYVGQFWLYEDIGGRETFVCPYDANSTWEERFFRFVVHEAFHTFQSGRFADRGDTWEQKYPITLTENNALATVENLILAEAVCALQREDRNEVNRRAEQFAVVRAYRLAKASPFVHHHEKVKERQENTAYYVETRAVEVGGLPEYTPTNFLNYGRFNPYLTRTEALQTLIDGIEDHLSDGAIKPTAMPRYRIYDNGAALGYLLDFLNIPWKSQATSDTSFVFHEPLLRHFSLPADTAALAERVGAIEDEFDYDGILASCGRNVEDFHLQVDSLRQAIRAGGGQEFRIVMGVERGLSTSKRSSARVLYTDEGQTTLIEKVDQFRAQTRTASVTIRDKGLIFTRPDDGDTITIALYDDQRATVAECDGSEIPLTAGVHPFHSSFSLSLDDRLEVTGISGSVTVGTDVITIVLE